MKILHIAPNAPYNKGWGYQENLLPKYQKKLGHEVTLIVQNRMHLDGRVVETAPEDVILEDGVRLIRLPHKGYFHRVLTNLCAYMEISPVLKEIRPDFVFFHGLISSTVFQVIQYKKKVNPACVIVQDNHLDENIGFSADTLKERLIRSFYRRVNRRSIPYVDRVYGVTPWRRTYAQEYFHIPSEKTDVLIMGADDEKMDFAHRQEIRSRIRREYGVSDGEFLIVTGGKIDRKKNVHLLMQACAGRRDVKLLTFGQVAPELQETFDRLLRENENITHVGWIDADRVYDYFFGADLVMFPGQHSVLWEQACAAKIPCVFARWEGMDHVDNGGNSAFLSGTDVTSIRQMIDGLCFTPEYHRMLEVARSEATDMYLYSAIAEKSLECARKGR
jgi:glycosyltransferase involved in cell wall biosynthesis